MPLPLGLQDRPGFVPAVREAGAGAVVPERLDPALLEDGSPAAFGPLHFDPHVQASLDEQPVRPAVVTDLDDFPAVSECPFPQVGLVGGLQALTG